jgi:hypothetical protein
VRRAGPSSSTGVSSTDGRGVENRANTAGSGRPSIIRAARSKNRDGPLKPVNPPEPVRGLSTSCLRPRPQDSHANGLSADGSDLERLAARIAVHCSAPVDEPCGNRLVPQVVADCGFHRAKSALLCTDVAFASTPSSRSGLTYRRDADTYPRRRELAACRGLASAKGPLGFTDYGDSGASRGGRQAERYLCRSGGL